MDFSAYKEFIDCTFWDVGLAIKRFKPKDLLESFVVENERGQRYYMKGI